MNQVKASPINETHLMVLRLFTTALAFFFLINIAWADADPPGWIVRENETGYICQLGTRPLFEFRSRDVPYKPYVSKLWTPSGINILRDSPQDHGHHHALMLGINVENIDFWAESPQGEQHPGSQKIQDIQTFTSDNPAEAGMQFQIGWTPSGGDPLISERRVIKAHAIHDPVTLLTWESVLATGSGREEVQLSGRHYEGLGMRFVESMDRAGRFFVSTGQLGPLIRGDERNTACAWCAYTAQVDGKPVTVAIFDHPKNDRPMVTFTMGDTGNSFAYLAATWNLWKQPMQLSANQPLHFLWGVAVWDGEVDSETVQSVRGQWLQLAGVSDAQAYISANGIHGGRPNSTCSMAIPESLKSRPSMAKRPMPSITHIGPRSNSARQTGSNRKGSIY
ncbi:MAG: PmoA family protein [Pirellulales bacterium]|nr:PmoA family protein [Pirellulales bacterium]